MIDAESSQRLVECPRHVSRVSVDPALTVGDVADQTELGRQLHFVPAVFEKLSHRTLARALAVHVGGVDERDPDVHRMVQRGERLGRIHRAVDRGDGHRAVSLGADSETFGQSDGGDGHENSSIRLSDNPDSLHRIEASRTD